MATPLPDPQPRMRVRLRRRHACGADIFIVGDLGADIRLFCEKCGTKVFVDRARWHNRVVEVLANPGEPA